MTTNRPLPALTATRPAGTWAVTYSSDLCAWSVTPDARILVTVLGVLYRVTEVLLPQTSTPVIIGLVRQTKTGRDYARGGVLVVEYADDARDVPADMAEVIEYADRCAAPVYNADAPVADRRALDVARAKATTGRTAPSMAAALGEPVTQRHADHCATHGHATWTVDGVECGTCARCGDVTVAAEPAQDAPALDADADADVPTSPVADDRPRTLAADHDGALIRGTARPTGDDGRVDVPAGTAVTVLRHPVPGWVSVVGDDPRDGLPFLFVVRAGDLDTIAPVDRPAEDTPAVDAPAVAAETTEDAPHCATCGQALSWETNDQGTPLLVADDGWGSVCGDAPGGFHVTAATLSEARGWLTDCGLSAGGDDAAVVARVTREYDGGWSSYLADVAPAMDAPVAPAQDG